MEGMRKDQDGQDLACGRGVSFREAVYAALVLCGFLALAVSGHYLTGKLLFTEVVWDPVGIYIFYPGNKVLIEGFQSGFFPLWDATRGLGAPHITPSLGIGDFPLKIPAYIINSLYGWELYILLRFFCAGLFCFLLAREIHLGFKGSLFAGVSYMLCGYFREFHNLPDFNVLLWLPLSMLLLTRLARQRSLFYFVVCVYIMSFLENNPESTALAIVYFSFYYLFVEYSQPRNLHTSLPKKIVPVFFILLTSFTAVLMDMDSFVPFFEYFVQSWHFHPEGLGHLHIPLQAGIGIVTPAFDYWMESPPNLQIENMEQLTLIPAYLGAVTFTLFLFAMLRLKSLPAPLLFFGGAAVVLAGIIFGVPPFTLLHHLPFIRDFQNFRYNQPYLAHAAAMLGGAGLEILLRNPRARKQALVPAAVVLAWTAGHVIVFHDHILASRPVLLALAGSVAGAVIIAVGAVILCRLYASRKSGIIAGAIILAAGLELSLYFNLVRPVFGPEAFKLAEPEAAAFIKQREEGPFRIWGLDQRIIHPNLAGLYGLADIRDQAPVYVEDYALFMGRINGWDNHRQMMNGFLENGKFYFDLEWENTTDGLLDVLNVRYVLSYGRPGSRSLLESAPKVRIISPAKNYVVPTELTVNKSFRKAVISHSPSGIELFLSGSTLSGDALAEAAVMPKSGKCPDHDGVFMSALKSGDRSTELLYARLLTPSRNNNWSPFHWQEEGEGRLVLASLPGPTDSRKCDYGVWSVPRVLPCRVPKPADHGLYEVYEGEFNVYENRDALPRVFGVTRLGKSGGLHETVTKILNNTPEETAWIASEEDFSESVSKPKVDSIREGPGWLSFKVDCPDRCFAVVSNLYYPGWRAWSGTEKKKVYRTDAVLQGVFLDTEDKEIKMTYEPVSFQVGWWFHFACHLFVGFMLIISLRRRR